MSSCAVIPDSPFSHPANPALQLVRAQPDPACKTVCRVLSRRVGDAPLILLVRATDFEWQVWCALLSIPPGSVLSYSGLAERVGVPRAVRAVASAVGRNPVAYLVPCHRVVPKGGGIGGYRWGSAVKQQLLEMEKAVIAAVV
jgi:AraC family transcriptional regulator of adaptative response/methylated-DNA-[protein]-cysteine methyltransferase